MPIQFPIEVKAITFASFQQAASPSSRPIGAWVKVRPAEENAKTYLGVYLGQLPVSGMVRWFEHTNTLEILPLTNPAMWVPDLNRIVWGCESWWGVIKSPAELSEITDADIANVWYVKALTDLSKA